MNMPVQDLLSPATNPLTQQELDHLAEVREVCRTVNTSGWQRILQQMKAFVEEASEDMIGAVYASDAIKANLQLRWQQRVSMLRGVEKYISDCEFKRQLLIEESKERSSQYAERDKNLREWPDLSETGDR